MFPTQMKPSKFLAKETKTARKAKEERRRESETSKSWLWEQHTELISYTYRHVGFASSISSFCNGVNQLATDAKVT